MITPLPEWNDKAPLPLLKGDLVEWLVTRHGFVVFSTWSMAEIAAAVEHRYGMGSIPRDHGPVAATWEVWAFVVKSEKAIRGGQTRLDL